MQPLSYQDPQQVKQLCELAAAAMSTDLSVRSPAEQQVKEFQEAVDRQTGLVGLLLYVIQNRPEAATFCSIVLKNTVRQCWNPATAEHCVQNEDKQFLRSIIVDIMLHAEGAVHRNLGETVATVADVDFPLAWPTALDPITVVLRESNVPATHHAALSTAHGVLVKYREQGELSEAFVTEMRKIYTMLMAPLLHSMQTMLQLCSVNQTSAVTEACMGLVSGVECLIDITSLDVADEFILNIANIVSLLQGCLSLQNAFLSSTTRHDGGPLVALKSVVMSCVTHFLTNYDEEFEKYAGEFLKVVWNVVADPANFTSATDDLVIRGLELLSSGCTGTCRATFEDAQLLKDLVERAIIPNLALQKEDVDTFNDEPEAYIQRDIEGSDLHTRRRAAGELVRTLVKTLPQQSCQLLSEVAQGLLAAPRDNWAARDTGIYLTSSLALEGKHVDTQRGAARQSLSHIVPFETFLSVTVLPELETRPGDSPIIKSDCIRVIAAFRDHISPSVYPNVLASLPACVASDNTVVSTYAANALDRLLLAQTPDRQFIVTEEMFAPHTGIILQALCAKMSNTSAPNAYVAQCLVRVLTRVPQSAKPYVEAVVGVANTVLAEASKNPSNPLFSHCLFEVLSKCIALRPDWGPHFEHLLWTQLSYILTNDVLEYVPYALQILAQLLAIHPQRSAEPPEHYKELLPPLANPDIYRQRGSIPAVVCLLTGFIAQCPAYVHAQGLTEKILGIFRALVQLKTYDHEGLNILSTMMLYYPPDVMARYLTACLLVLVQRMQTGSTPKFIRIFIIFLSMTVCVRGPEDLVTRMNEIQPNLFFMVLDRIWLRNMQKVTGILERKVCIVALARLLCESAELQSQPQAWAQSVFSCLRMIHEKEETDDHTSFAPTTATFADLAKLTNASSGVGAASGLSAEGPGFTNVFCPLEEAVRKPVDVCESVTVPDQYFREQMRKLLSSSRGPELLNVLRSVLSPELLALIQ